jgi:hypothetical protein
MRPQQGERWGFSEMGSEARHGFQGVWSAVEDVFPKGEKSLRWPPILLTAGGGRRKGGMRGAYRGPPLAQD